jgi:WD40 repeat protein
MERIAAVVVVLLLCDSLRGDAPPAGQRAAVDGYGDPLPAGALARLGTSGFRLPGWFRVTSCQLSPDGRLLAVTNGEQIAFLDALTGRKVSVLHEGSNLYPDLAFTRDGTLLAGADRQNIYVWHVASGKERRRLAVPTDPLEQPTERLLLSSLSFSGDGKTLAATFIGHMIRVGITTRPGPGRAFVWDMGTGAVRYSHGIPPDLQPQAALSTDGKVLATWGRRFRATPKGGWHMALHIWDVATGKELWTKEVAAPGSGLPAAAFTPDRKALAAVSGMSSVWLWEVATGKEVRRLSGPPTISSPVWFSRDGGTVAAVAPGGAIQLWEMASGKRLALERGPGCWPSGLAFLAPGKLRACRANGQAASVWDLPEGRLLSPASGHEHTVRQMCYVDSGKGLVSVGDDGMICWWDCTKGNEVRHHLVTGGTFRDQPGFANARMTLSQDGKLLAGSDAADPTINLWDTATGKRVRTLAGPKKLWAEHLAFSPDGGRLATEDVDHAVHVWDLAKGVHLRRLDPPAGAMNFNAVGERLAFSPDGRLLAVMEHINTLDSGHIVLWNLAAGKELRRFHALGALTVALSPDGQVLATAGHEGGTLWDVATGYELSRLEAPEADIWHLAFSPDGRSLAGGCHIWKATERGVCLWETATGRLRWCGRGHSQYVSCLCFTQEGSVLASGSQDTTILLWDVTGRHLVGAAKREPEALWADMEGVSAQSAFRAAGALLAEPSGALALFRQRLQPARVPAFNEAVVRKRIAELDDPRFATRERAARDLEAAGKAAEPLLRERLNQGLSLEARRRIEQLIPRVVKARPRPKELAALRAIEILERIGNAEARELLRRLADGHARSSLTEQARAALARLTARR